MPNLWMEHVKKFREQNPGMTLRDSMKQAKLTYNLASPISQQSGGCMGNTQCLPCQMSGGSGIIEKPKRSKSVSAEPSFVVDVPKPKPKVKKSKKKNPSEEELIGQGLNSSMSPSDIQQRLQRIEKEMELMEGDYTN